VTTNRLTQAPRILAGPISAPSSANPVFAGHTVCVVPKPPVASTFTRRGMLSRELSCPSPSASWVSGRTQAQACGRKPDGIVESRPRCGGRVGGHGRQSAAAKHLRPEHNGCERPEHNGCEKNRA
jgi:hypothetical protein